MQINTLIDSLILQHAADIFYRYAEKSPHIRRIFFYGSRVTNERRAKKSAKEVSDLDVAIEFITNYEEQLKWDELKLCKELFQPNFLFNLHIELFDDKTPHIHSYLEMGSILIYDKHGK